MKKINDLPEKIPIFPLSNFIIFPETTVPLNIFEPRYIQMIDDSMKSNRMIGMIQPKKSSDLSNSLYDVGCLGKITSFNETKDGRYLIVVNGISRFEVLQEEISKKLYRECIVNYKNYSKDLTDKKEDLKFSDLELIFKNIKSIFKKQGYLIDWKELEKQSLDLTINTLSMASPFTMEEKQILLETIDIQSRKKKLEEISNTYLMDNFNNKTLQ